MTHKVVFNLRMLWAKTLINYSNNDPLTSDVSLPNISHIVCGLSIISVLNLHK